MSAVRRRPRLSELKGTLRVLRDNGLKPCALDCQPDGTYRLRCKTLLLKGKNSCYGSMEL